MKQTSTNPRFIDSIISELRHETPRAQKLRTELLKSLDRMPRVSRRRRHARRLYIAAHVGKPFNISGVMVNRLALDILQLQDPKYGEKYVKLVGEAKTETTRRIDAYMYTLEGTRVVRENIQGALKAGHISEMTRKAPRRRRSSLRIPAT